MTQENIDTPVLIIIFNRPDKVKRLVEALSVIRPARLYVAADGPRPHVSTDSAKCAEARKAALQVTWPCEVKTLFSDGNLGINAGVEAAINWFFANVESGIILEDDCIPSADFFRFSGEMLAHYRDNEKVMMISGDNFQKGIRRGDGDYYFSRYPNIWGWATWGRAWKRYDRELTGLPQFIAENRISNICTALDERRHWLGYFKKLRNKSKSSWDAKWVFAIWNADGLCINPNVNLVTNIGFGTDATNTIGGEKSPLTETQDLPRKIISPSRVQADASADRYVFETIFKVTFFDKIRYILSIFYEKTRSRIAKA